MLTLITDLQYKFNSNGMRKKSFIVIARSALATKQSNNLLKSLKARLLRYARNDLSVVFPQTAKMLLLHTDKSGIRYGISC